MSAKCKNFRLPHITSEQNLKCSRSSRSNSHLLRVGLTVTDGVKRYPTGLLDVRASATNLRIQLWHLLRYATDMFRCMLKAEFVICKFKSPVGTSAWLPGCLEEAVEARTWGVFFLPLRTTCTRLLCTTRPSCGRETDWPLQWSVTKMSFYFDLKEIFFFVCVGLLSLHTRKQHVVVVVAVVVIIDQVDLLSLLSNFFKLLCKILFGTTSSRRRFLFLLILRQPNQRKKKTPHLKIHIKSHTLDTCTCMFLLPVVPPPLGKEK